MFSARSRNAMQNTPLHAAAAGRNLDAVRALLEHGADVNAPSGRRLDSAARRGAEWRCGNGPAADRRAARDVQARADNNQNALDLALTKGHQAVGDMLDEYAATDVELPE